MKIITMGNEMNNFRTINKSLKIELKEVTENYQNMENELNEKKGELGEFEQ